MSRTTAWTSCLACLCLATACVVMKPVPPSPELGPVAIGDDAGSGRTFVDADAPARVEVRYGPKHALLVRPVINETDAGWFVLDTGASAMLITSAAAGNAGLVPIGTTRLQTGRTTTVFLGESFRLGPLTLNGTKYAGADFPFTRATFGEKAQGICGYDLFAETIFELDAGSDAIGFYDPATYELEAGRWEELILHSNLPHVRCRFEGGHSGVFMLDTGFGGSVWFFESAVERFDLLEGRKTRGRTILNFGASNKVREGRLEWFELGGRRIEDIEAHYSTEPPGLYLGPREVMGIVGMELMSRFRIVFDYAHQRVALIPVTVPAR